MASDREAYILYEGVGDPSGLRCSHCNNMMQTVAWWWTPEENHFVVCGYCAPNFDCRDEWPVELIPKSPDEIIEQLSFWDG